MSPHLVKVLLRVAVVLLASVVALLFWAGLAISGLWLVENNPYICVSVVLLILAAVVESLGGHDGRPR